MASRSPPRWRFTRPPRSVLYTRATRSWRSDGVTLEAPIVAFGLFEHLPEGALPLTSLLELSDCNTNCQTV